ncbi:MAG: alkyl hydroperoxide reductase [Candidatus Hydrogenedentota bacterium]
MSYSKFIAAGIILSMPFAASAAEKVTFTKDVLPILQENCQICHRPEGANLGGMVAPMAFTTYQEVRPWAKAIAKAVSNRDMPPWDATAEFHGVFENERTISQAAIDTIVAWAEQGAARGSLADAPEPLKFPDTDGWQIGEPDLVVSMPERYFVEDDVEDLYVTFQTDVTEEMLSEDRWLKAIEFRPGSSVVHHIISDGLGGIAPGNDPSVMREGFSSMMRAGTKVNWQMHYHKEPGPGTGVWDQSRVGLNFYPKDFQPEHQIHGNVMGKMDFRIPAGKARHTETVSTTFKDDIMLLSYTPHMHLRGVAAKYTATYPDGSQEVVLDVPQYDFNWQTSYKYAEPKILPKGTSLEVAMTWDNSPENETNPDPTQTVTFGQPTTDEMMFGFVSYAYVDEPETVVLSQEELAKYAGTYSIGGVQEFEVSQRGNVLIIGLGDREAELEPISDTEFAGPFGMVITFTRNEAGLTESVSLKMGETQNFTAKRVQ